MNLFVEARWKIEWAQQHSARLHEEWRAFIESDPHEVTIDKDDDGINFLAIRPTLIPNYIPLAVGDVVHNIRSALDYALSELLDHADTRLTFPISKSKQALKDSFLTQPEPRGAKTAPIGTYAVLEAAYPEIWRIFVERIRSFEGGNPYIWPLHRLDVRDKHRLLIMITGNQEITGIDIANPDGRVFGRHLTVRNQIGQNFLPFGGHPDGSRVVNKGSYSAEIFFDESGVSKNLNVFQMLAMMEIAASEALNSLEEFVVAKSR